MTSVAHTQSRMGHPIDTDRRNYQRVFRLTFVFFMTAALVGRLLPGARKASAAGEPESLIDEARRMSSTILPFIFIR